ncbi:MAG: hypothetical protein EOP04_22430 [Proteobacteria bacterium]|nr:MAG: hypothetical protein EOP04_22430 [Pseudomonadota bacterium]
MKWKIAILAPILLIWFGVWYQRASQLPETPTHLVVELMAAMRQKNVVRVRMLCSASAYSELTQVNSSGVSDLLSMQRIEDSPWDIWKKWSEVCGISGFTSKPFPIEDGLYSVGDRWGLFGFVLKKTSRGWYVSKCQYAIYEASHGARLENPTEPTTHEKWE